MMAKLDAFRDEIHVAWEHPDNAGHRARTVWRLSRMHALARMGRPARFPLGGHSHILVDARFPSTRKVALGNPPDRAQLTVWKEFLGPGKLFVDVGANAGLYSVWAADLGAEVIAVEPNPDARAALERNARLNGYTFTIVDAALFASAGTVRMTERLGPKNHLLPGESDRGVEVTTTTLDDVLGDRVADGIKIDVEGAERFVLEGAHQALAQGRIRAMQLEYNNLASYFYGETREPLREMLRGYGYELFRVDEDGARRTGNIGLGGGKDIFAVLPR